MLQSMNRMAPLLSLLLLSACNSSNNLLMGTVQADLGKHHVTVTDCYRTTVTPPANGRFTPCRDADIVIADESLTVNGRSYGRLNPDDSVLVDHGVVSIQGNNGGQRAAN